MAIVTPYPVGTVTDPFGTCEDCVVTDPYANTITDPYADCEGCPTFDPNDPYPTATFTYNPPWVAFSPTWSVYNYYSSGNNFIVYDGNVYFITDGERLRQLNMSTGAYTLKAPPLEDDEGQSFLVVPTGGLKGLYCTRRHNPYDDYRLLKWNEVDAWTNLSRSKNNQLCSMVYVSPYIYIGSKYGMEIWNGSSLSAVVRVASPTYNNDFPRYLWYDSGLIYAFMIDDSTVVDGYIASWDFTGSPGVFTQLTSKIPDCYDYSMGTTRRDIETIWYDNTIYFHRNYRELLRFNKSTHEIETVIAATSDYIRSFLVHSDGWLYAYTNTQQLLRWKPGEVGWSEIIAAYVGYDIVDWTTYALLEHNTSIYAITATAPGVNIVGNQVSKMEITESGCAITDPYDYESLCADPAYTT